MPLLRYPRVRSVKFMAERLEALMTMVEFLTSADYTEQLLISTHLVPKRDAARRAKAIGAHVKTALAYIDQARGGSPDVAPLPSYYAVLNLLKVYILCSGSAARLSANRWHGASYDGYAKTSHSLRTEEIVLRSGGAIPLAYEVITGQRIRDKTSVRLGDVYGYIPAVSVEWSAASGEDSMMANLVASVVTGSRGLRAQIDLALLDPPTHVPPPKSVARIPALANVVARRKFYGFHSKPWYLAATPEREIFRLHVRPYLLYESTDPREELSVGYTPTPICSRSLLMPEELPIVLALFHLSSVVRYQPEMLARLRDSRYWPVVASLRLDGVCRFLELFWSYTHQEVLHAS